MAGEFKFLKFFLILLVVFVSFQLVSADTFTVQTSLDSKTSQITNSNFLIFSDTFISTQPSYNSACGGGNVVIVTPDNSKCWTVDLTFQGKSFRASSGSSVQLNHFFNVTPVISATYDGNKAQVNSGWTISLVFNVNDKNFITVLPVNNQVSQLNNFAYLTVSSVNNYGSSLNGGYYVDSFNDELGNGTLTVYDQLFTTLDNRQFSFLSNHLGVTRYSFSPYVTLTLPDHQIKIFSNSYSTGIVDVLPDISHPAKTETTCVIDSDCPDQFSCLKYSDTLKLCTKQINQDFRNIHITRSDSSTVFSSPIFLIGAIVIVGLIVAVKKNG